MLTTSAPALAEPVKAPTWGAAPEPEPIPPAWMAPGPLEPSRKEEELKVVMTRMSSVRPRSIPPEARSPSIRPGASELGAELGPESLRAPSVPVTEALSLELAARTAELHEVIENAAEAVRAARRQALETSEDSLVRLACAIARRIVGRELETDPALVRNWVHEGIASLCSDDAVEVRVAPGLAAHLGVLEADITGRTHADVIVDDKLAATQIEIVGRYGRVAAGLEERFEAVCDALGLEGDDD